MSGSKALDRDTRTVAHGVAPEAEPSGDAMISTSVLDSLDQMRQAAEPEAAAVAAAQMAPQAAVPPDQQGPRESLQAVLDHYTDWLRSLKP